MQEFRQKKSTYRGISFIENPKNANWSVAIESRSVVALIMGVGDKRAREPFSGSNGYVHYLYHVDDFPDVYTFQNLPNCTF